jgi:serine/threonine protein kinase
MTTDRYQRIKQVFMAAVEKPTAQRAEFLAEACQGDSMLREEVEFLLASDDCATSFIENPALASVSDIFEEVKSQQESHPKRIGPYDVLGVVGSGGMGTVYRAIRADDQYRKLVAIKLVRKGMDTEPIIQRFRRERQILASLEHPNIAQLLDGGTIEDGRPYFVMEYVEGTPIDVYCDQHKLSTRQRLELFRTVLAAVAHAHRNLVIHRDLKPGNILVKADGSIKLLDFGIAKVLHPDAATQALERTATALRIMTPQYASPEQVRGDPLTTASDVYLLGVVLYELLTGHRPYRLRGGDTMEVIRALGHGEPEKPSTAVSRVIEEADSESGSKHTLTPETVSRTRGGRPSLLRRSLEGDIDYIILKALRKDPAERYSSAEHMSEDVRRHLQHHPVLARKQTVPYRVSCFVSRHRGAVLASSVVAVILVASLAGMLWQGNLARQRLAGAERRFERAQSALDSVWSDVHDALPASRDTLLARQILADRAIVYLDELARDPGSEERIRTRAAGAYRKIAGIYRGAGDMTRALRSTQQAITIYERLAAEIPDSRVQEELAAALRESAQLTDESGDLPAALTQLEKAVKIAEDLAGGPDKAAKARLIDDYDALTSMYLKAGLTNEAVEASRKELIAAQEALTRDPRNSQSRRELAIAQQRYGEALEQADNLAGAIENYQISLAAFQALSAETSGSRQSRRDLAGVYEKLALAQSRNQANKPATDGYQRGLAIRRELAVTGEAQYRSELAMSLLGYGDLMGRMSDRPSQISAHREAIDILMSSDAGDVVSRRRLLQALRHIESLDQAKQVLQFAGSWLVKDSKKQLAGFLAANAHLRIGELLLRANDQAGCLQNLRLAINTLEAIPERTAEWRRAAALVYARLGEAHAVLGRNCAEASTAVERSRAASADWSRLPRERAVIDQITAVAARCGQGQGPSQ